MSHDVQWYSPAPLWSERQQNGTRGLRRPALLQFGTDDFMGELQRVLEDARDTLSSQVAEKKENGDLSFYQPAHQRYYLVTASLVCRERGLPDRAVDTTNEESAEFVLRRLVTEETDDGDEVTREYGWTGSAWRPVSDAEKVAAKETRMKMFPKSYPPDAPIEQMKGDRRVWAGLIPAGKRDTFETAPVQSDNVLKATATGTVRTMPSGNGIPDSGPAANGAPPATEESNETSGDESNADKKGAASLPPKGNSLSDPRKTKFATRVIEAFRGVKKALEKNKSEVSGEDVRDPLVFAWFDLWQFLGEHFDGLQKKIRDGDSIGSGDSKVLQVLDAIDVSGMKDWNSATDALRAVAQNETDVKAGDLDGILKTTDLPREGGELNRTELLNIVDRILTDKVGDFGKSGNNTPALQDIVEAGLGTLSDPSKLTGDLKPPSTDPVGTGRYVVRCLYERPKCPPSHRIQLSKRSRSFRLASFFDAGAPSRDINIALPSAAMKDLRDSSQSVSLVFTKELRRQAERVQDITLQKLQDGEVGDAPKVNIGMICSLSIPIITICALVLLLVIVIVLNIVFWWLPFFKICFPLPSSDG